MLNVCNVEKSSFVCVIPLGLLGQVRYNDKGVISEINTLDKTTGEPNGKLPPNIVVSLQKSGLVPSRLVDRRSCTVKFVLKERTYNLVKIQEQGLDSYIESLINRSEEGLEVVAYDVQFDNIASFNTSSMFTQLNLMGFTLVQKFMVSDKVLKSNKLLEDSLRSYGYPFISGYYILTGNKNKSYYPSNISVDKIQCLRRSINVNGFIEAILELTKGGDLILPYPEAVLYNIRKGSVVVIDDGKVRYCNSKTGTGNLTERKFHCKSCGTLITSPSYGFLRCPYDNCPSLLLTKVGNFIHTLDLPEVDIEEYTEALRKGTIRTLCDLFTLSQYSDISITCTCADLLRALCPLSVVRNRDFFDKFVQSAGSLDAIYHYIEYPEEITKDMSSVLDNTQLSNFSTWVQDPENVLTIKTFLDINNVHIVDSRINLEVPYIFRNKTVCLEGSFKHGSFQDVKDILSSYGATVVSEFESKCSCVILGAFVRNPDENTVAQTAVSYNIPVFTETDFFEAYGIDMDLTQNK